MVDAGSGREAQNRIVERSLTQAEIDACYSITNAILAVATDPSGLARF